MELFYASAEGEAKESLPAAAFIILVVVRSLETLTLLDWPVRKRFRSANSG